MTSRYVTLSHKPIFRFSALSLMLLQAQYLFANENNTQTAVMPTIKIEAMSLIQLKAILIMNKLV
jgi:iron complex outermembrane receptor protein